MVKLVKQFILNIQSFESLLMCINIDEFESQTENTVL